MTDEAENTLNQIREMIEQRLPQEGIKANAGLSMWQFWLAIATIVFFAGATTIQIQNNSESTKINAEHIEGNTESLAAHMQWELEHEIAVKDQQIKALKAKQ